MHHRIDRDKCISCWGCLQTCPVGAIFQNSDSAIINPAFCTDCGFCAKVCPVDAVCKTDTQFSEDFADTKSPSKHHTGFESTLECDVVVIGGGPAGLTAAYFIAKKGGSVTVIERRKELGVPVACAEGISVTGLKKAFEPHKRWISSTIEGVRLYTPTGRMIFIDHPSAGFVLDRPIFENDIAQMALDVGAEIFTETSVIEISGYKTIDYIVIEQNEQLRKIIAKHYIDASGIAGIAAMWAFPQTKLSEEGFHTCAQVLLESDDFNHEPVAEFWWGSEIAPGGYVWVFPKGGKRANVGLGIIPKLAGQKRPADFLQTFLQKRFSDYTIIEHRDGVVPATKRLSPMGRGNLLLAGDAARLTNAISGGGLDSALASGKLAAETISNLWNSPHEKILAEYEKQWKSSAGKLLDLYAKLRMGIVQLSDNELEIIADVIERNLAGKTWYALDIPAIVWDIAKTSPKLLKIAGKFFINYFKG